MRGLTQRRVLHGRREMTAGSPDLSFVGKPGGSIVTDGMGGSVVSIRDSGAFTGTGARHSAMLFLGLVMMQFLLVSQTTLFRAIEDALRQKTAGCMARPRIVRL